MFSREEVQRRLRSLSVQDQETPQAKFLKEFCEKDTYIFISYVGFLSFIMENHEGCMELFDNDFMRSGTDIANLFSEFLQRTSHSPAARTEEDIDADLYPSETADESGTEQMNEEEGAVYVHDYSMEEKAPLSQDATKDEILEQSNFSANGRIGALAYLDKKYESAVWYLEEAVSENSSFKKPYGYLGCSYLALEEHEKALINLTLALKDHHPEISLDALYHRGVAFVQVGEYDAAIRDFDRVMRLSTPSHPLRRCAFDSRNATYNHIGNFREVVKNTSEALNEGCDEGNELHNLEYRGLAYFGLRKYDAAIQDFNRAIGVTPFGLHYASLAIVKFYQGDISGAIQNLDKATVLAPTALNNFLFRAMCHIRLNNFNLAEKDLLAISAAPLVDSDFTLRFIANFTLRELERAGKLAQPLSDAEIFERDSTKDHVLTRPNKSSIEYYACALIAEESGDEKEVERTVYDLFNSQTYTDEIYATTHGGMERFAGKSKDIQEAKELVARFSGVRTDNLISELKQRSPKVLNHAYLLVARSEPVDRSFCIALRCVGAKNKTADLVLSRKTPEKFFDLVQAVRNGDLNIVKAHMTNRYSDPNGLDEHGRLIICLAIDFRRYDVAEYLLKDSPVEIDINRVDASYLSLLQSLCQKILTVSPESHDAKKLFELLNYIIKVKKADLLFRLQGLPSTLDQFLEEAPPSPMKLLLRAVLDTKMSQPKKSSGVPKSEPPEKKEKHNSSEVKRDDKHFEKPQTKTPTQMSFPPQSQGTLDPAPEAVRDDDGPSSSKLQPSVLSEEQKLIADLEKRIAEVEMTQATRMLKPALFVELPGLKAELEELRYLTYAFGVSDEKRIKPLRKNLAQLEKGLQRGRKISKTIHEEVSETKKTQDAQLSIQENKKTKNKKPKPKKPAPDYNPDVKEKFPRSMREATANILAQLREDKTHFPETQVVVQEQRVEEGRTFVVLTQPNNPVSDVPPSEKSLARKACSALLNLIEESKAATETDKIIDKYSKLYDITTLLKTAHMGLHASPLDIFFDAENHQYAKTLYDYIIRGGGHRVQYEKVLAFANRITRQIPSIIDYFSKMDVPIKPEELTKLRLHAPVNPINTKRRPIVQIQPLDFATFRSAPAPFNPEHLTRDLFRLIDQVASHPAEKGGPVREYDRKTRNALLMLMILCREEVVRLEKAGTLKEVHGAIITFSNHYLEAKQKTKKGNILSDDLKELVKEVQLFLGKNPGNVRRPVSPLFVGVWDDAFEATVPATEKDAARGVSNGL